MLLSDAAEGYLLFKSTRASANTIETDRVLLRQFCDWCGSERDVRDVTPDDLREYVTYQRDERGLAVSTVRRHYVVVSAPYAWLCSPGVELADENPARSVPLPKQTKRKPKALSKDQLEAIIAACEESRYRRRAKAIVLFLVDTGARASELAGLTVSDVNFQTGKVRVRGKGDKERFVYLGKRALSALWLYVKEERPEPSQVGDGHLFLTWDGYPLNRDSLRQLIGRLGKVAGTHVHPHQFRHTAAIEHLRHGMDLLSVQRLLGHETLEVTQGYLDALSDEDVEKRARQTSPADNWRL